MIKICDQPITITVMNQLKELKIVQNTFKSVMSLKRSAGGAGGQYYYILWYLIYILHCNAVCKIEDKPFAIQTFDFKEYVNVPMVTHCWYEIRDSIKDHVQPRAEYVFNGSFFDDDVETNNNQSYEPEISPPLFPSENTNNEEVILIEDDTQDLQIPDDKSIPIDNKIDNTIGEPCPNVTMNELFKGPNLLISPFQTKDEYEAFNVKCQAFMSKDEMIHILQMFTSADIITDTDAYDINEFNVEKQKYLDLKETHDRRLQKFNEDWEEDWRQFAKPNHSSKDPYKTMFHCNAKPDCTFVANINQSAKRHVITCLGIRYICVMCGQTYTRVDKLKLHLDKYSNIENLYAIMESGYVEKVKFSMNYHLYPILHLHYFYWEDEKENIVGISVGFSGEQNTIKWATNIISKVTSALENMKKTAPKMQKIVLKPEKKHYCASAFYAYTILKWKPISQTAASFNVRAFGESCANSLKGYYRRLLNAIFVTASVDERGNLDKVQRSLYNIAEDIIFPAPIRNAMEDNVNEDKILKPIVFNKFFE